MNSSNLINVVVIFFQLFLIFLVNVAHVRQTLFLILKIYESCISLSFFTPKTPSSPPLPSPPNSESKPKGKVFHQFSHLLFLSLIISNSRLFFQSIFLIILFSEFFKGLKEPCFNKY